MAKRTDELKAELAKVNEKAKKLKEQLEKIENKQKLEIGAFILELFGAGKITDETILAEVKRITAAAE